jgi:hypothetical protein
MDNTSIVKAHIDFQSPRVSSAFKGASGCSASVASSAPDALLGNTAKSSPPPQDLRLKMQSKRAERYEALSVARFILGKYAKVVDPRREPGDLYRTHDCRYTRRSRFVGVHYSAAHQSAHYSGLATCGSVWACPVCCAVVQQRRRAELAQLISWAYANGYRPCMVTFTFPHKSFQSLQDLKERQRDAFTRLRRGSPWQRFKDRCGFGGLVRSLEVTHGANGWHPHTHEIWLIRHQTETEQANFQAEIKQRWQKVCIAAGLLDASDRSQVHAFDMHAVDVRFGVNDSDYLAKQDSSRAWGADREVATASSKSGRSKGVHPHEFLIRRAKGDGALYLEYVNGMAGSRQLFWSPGLKELVGVLDVTDEVLADESLTPSDMLGDLSADEWSLIRYKRKRAQLLNIAESGDWLQVQRFLVQVVGIKPDRFAALPYPLCV